MVFQLQCVVGYCLRQIFVVRDKKVICVHSSLVIIYCRVIKLSSYLGLNSLLLSYFDSLLISVSLCMANVVFFSHQALIILTEFYSPTVLILISNFSRGWCVLADLHLIIKCINSWINITCSRQMVTFQLNALLFSISCQDKIIAK